MRDEIYIKCGDQMLDTDEGSRVGFSYKSRWLMEKDGGKYRTFDLSVPATDTNNKVFLYDEEPVAAGVRQGMSATVSSGGVLLDGVLFVSQYSGGRYNLLFVHGVLSRAFSVVPSWAIDNVITVEDKMQPTTSGRIPDFGFYQYDSGAFQGVVYPPLSLFPCANLGYLINTFAAYGGYTVNYPPAALGRRYQADAYGLILSTMNVYTRDSVTATGSGVGGWNATVAGGGTLSQLGLDVVGKWFKRGLFDNKKIVFAFVATRPITVVIADGQNVVIASGQGYELHNSWSGIDGCTIEMETGDWFTAVSPADWTRHFGHEKWNGGLINPHGYESTVSVSFEVCENTGVPSSGSQIDLSMNLPSLTLQQYLDAYCMIICAVWDIDEEAKEINIHPFDEMLGSLNYFISLDDRKVTSISSVKRYIEGWSRHNYIRCDSKNVQDESYFKRDYPVENDYLDEEREVGVIPFNEGDWALNQYGQKELFSMDVVQTSNGELHYEGVVTVFYENALHDGALHIQTVNDEGVGVDYAAFTRQATTVEVNVAMSLQEFMRIEDRAAVTFRGATYVVESAQWGDGSARLVLLSVNI